MRSITRDYVDPPEILVGKSCLRKTEELHRQKNKHDFSFHYYRHDTVVERLKKLYFNKCAYCESRLGTTGPLRIDHYRPKDGIKGETHTGYYWLGYEWSNLLPACEACNGVKSNRFPVSGTRVLKMQGDKKEFVVNSVTFLAEAPLIINPEVDKPERHFAFNQDGTVLGLNDRAKTTIDVCDLNREILVLARKKRADYFKNRLRKVLRDQIEGKINKDTFKYTLKGIFSKALKAVDAPQATYSRLNWFIFKFFDPFFIEPLGPKSRETVRKAFHLFLAGKL